MSAHEKDRGKSDPSKNSWFKKPSLLFGGISSRQFAIAILVGIASFAISYSLDGANIELNSDRVFVFLPFLAISIFLIVFYLFKDVKNPESSEKLFSDLGSPEPNSPLKQLVEELLTSHLASEGKEVVRAKLASTFKESVNEHISALVEDGFKLKGSSKASKEDGTAMTDALRYATTMDEKYRAQIERLTSQQNLSLYIGLLFAFAGAIVLCLLLFAPSFNPHSGGNWDIVAGYVSKALTVVFLEVFAFFFLRNYRLIFSEIKYYQQKRNDLQGKVVALRIAIASDDYEAMIERAFDAFLSMPEDKPYTRDHTTESLEREKMLNENQGRVYDLLEKAIDKLGSASTVEKKQKDASEKGED